MKTNEQCINEWANMHATAFVDSVFAKKIFSKENGEKYHAVMPVTFIALPLNDGTLEKRIVEFPTNIRQILVKDENDDSWKDMLCDKITSWLMWNSL